MRRKSELKEEKKTGVPRGEFLKISSAGLKLMLFQLVAIIILGAGLVRYLLAGLNK